MSAWITAPSGEKEIVLDPTNMRVKALGLQADDLVDPIVAALGSGLDDDRAPYTKFIIYALPDDEEVWADHGLQKEGVIRGYFSNGIDAHLWALYGDGNRSESPNRDEHNRITALARQKKYTIPSEPDSHSCRTATEADAPDISNLLRNTFTEYPTPLDPATIALAVREETHRFRTLVNADGELVAVASAEIDHRRRSAEMTDCATRPDQRGSGFMSYLLWQLEVDMATHYGINDLYTLARADEPGMNCAFAKLGYAYTGCLVNNCRMPNGWESMNIWCRRTEPAPGIDDSLTS